MNGWLVYSPGGYALNRWFADRLTVCAAAEGVPLELRLIPEDGVLPPGPLPPFAVMRCIRPDLSAALEAHGVRVFNGAATARIANDKWETFLLARDLGVPTLETVRFVWPGPPPLPPPYVVKSLDGHGGSEVFCVRSADALAEAVAQTGKRAFVAQPLCDEPGVDMRLYAVGGETVAAVRRVSRTDFRSNFKLGGEVAPATPTEGQREAVRRLHGRLGFDFAGVDFIRHGGRWVLNEVEDVVGTRMLYATGGPDAARLLAVRIAASVPARAGA